MHVVYGVQDVCVAMIDLKKTGINIYEIQYYLFEFVTKKYWKSLFVQSGCRINAKHYHYWNRFNRGITFLIVPC